MKLKRFLATLLLVFISTITVRAQDTSTSQTGWPITTRCIGDLPQPLPREKWTFDGVIFSENDNGVRAIRTDFPTSYYVVLAGDNSFAFDGSFSPDGKKFTYPTGSTSYGNSISNSISIDALQVVTTTPHQVRLTIPWQDFYFSGMGRGSVNVSNWLDNDHFIKNGTIINAVTGDITPMNRKTPFTTLFAISPNAERAFYYEQFGNGGYKLYDVKNDKLIDDLPARFEVFNWLPDSSGFAGSVSQVDSQDHLTSSLIIFDKDALPKVTLISNTPDTIWIASLSPDGNHLAFILGSQMYIAEINTKQIIDLCFDVKQNHFSIAWSPDSANFVISYDGFPVIVNVETLEMQSLRYEVDYIWGWYPVD